MAAPSVDLHRHPQRRTIGAAIGNVTRHVRSDEFDHDIIAVVSFTASDRTLAQTSVYPHRPRAGCAVVKCGCGSALPPLADHAQVFLLARVALQRRYRHHPISHRWPRLMAENGCHPRVSQAAPPQVAFRRLTIIARSASTSRFRSAFAALPLLPPVICWSFSWELYYDLQRFRVGMQHKSRGCRCGSIPPLAAAPENQIGVLCR